MHKYISEYPKACEDRELQAKEMFPYEEMSADEYAALEGHNWHCFSFDDYIYSDPVLNEWIHSLGDIFFSRTKMGKARKNALPTNKLHS